MGRSRHRAAALLTALLLPLLLPCRLRAADLEKIRAGGTLRVLTAAQNQPEFVSLDQEGARGFDYEVLEGFAKLNRVSLEIVPSSGWDQLVPDLLRGKGDVIAGQFTDTESRRKLIDFTVEVFPTRAVIVTRSPHRVVTTLEQVRREERIIVIHGTSMVNALMDVGVGRSHIDDSFPAGQPIAAALRSGQITCTALEIQAAIVARRHDPDLQIGVFVGPPASLAYGVAKEAPALRDALNEYIHNLRRTPTWSRLVVKYFGETALEVLRKARGE
jgi:ABC-type amino acid transport substrate-binding protein